MRIVVIGAGAVGGYFAGRLAEAGEDVAVVARGETLDVLQQTGMTLIDVPHPPRRVTIPAYPSLAAAGDCDIVLVATKALDGTDAFAGLAVQRRNHGESLSKSAINAAMARLRPILMTSFAFIIGLLPLVFAGGIGSAGNRSVATGAVSGLLIGTFIGLIVIPVLYVIFQWLQEKISGKQTSLEA